MSGGGVASGESKPAAMAPMPSSRRRVRHRHSHVSPSANTASPQPGRCGTGSVAAGQPETVDRTTTVHLDPVGAATRRNAATAVGDAACSTDGIVRGGAWNGRQWTASTPHAATAWAGDGTVVLVSDDTAHGPFVAAHATRVDVLDLATGRRTGDVRLPHAAPTGTSLEGLYPFGHGSAVVTTADTIRLVGRGA